MFVNVPCEFERLWILLLLDGVSYKKIKKSSRSMIVPFTHTGLMIERMPLGLPFVPSKLVFSLNLTFSFESLSWLLHQMIILWFYRLSPSDARWD